MPIAIDASSPAQIQNNDSQCTTASFTPPAGSFLVCVFVFDDTGGLTPDITSTGLTFTSRVSSTGNRIWTAPVASSSARTVTATDGQGGFGGGAFLKVWVVTGQHATPVGNTGSGTATGDTSVNGYTSSVDNSWGFAGAWVSNDLNTPSSTDVETVQTAHPNDIGMSITKAAATSTSGSTVTFNLGHTNGSASWQWAAIEIVPADTSSAEQEGYRFRNDNGSETTATWRQSQDTADTAVLDEILRLRMLLNSTGDRPTAQYQLEYRENSETWYRAIGVGHPGTLPTITSATGTADATAGTTVAAAYPATVAAGDLLIWVVAKDDDATGITDTTGGLNVIANGNSETGTDGVCLFVGWEIADGSEGGTTRTFTGDSEEWQTYCVRILAGEFDASNPIDSAGTLNGGTSGEAITDAFTCVRPGGLVIACGAVDIDPMDATFSPTGWTDVADNDAGEVTAWVSRRDAATTTAETVASATFGINASDANTCIAFVVSAPLGTPAVTFATSANYADGDATTAQLTAPAGKTTSDFDAGVMVEGQALADTVDITADDYTEIEWALKAQTPAIVTDVYQFRVTAAGTPLASYTVTPELTIASSSPTGSGAPTQANQTANGSGTLTITGSGAATQANQTAAGSGTHTQTITGTATAAQADQTAAGSGTHTYTITGTGAATQDSQTAAGSGYMQPSGSAAVTQADQTAAGSGTHTQTITGSGAPTQADQTASGSGTHTQTITGAGASAQADQTAAGVGSLTITGTGAATQADQIAAGAGTHTYTITGTGAATQEDQVAAGSGTHTYTITGTGASTQADQTASGSGTHTYTITGSGASTQADQTAAGNGSVGSSPTGVGAAAQADQTANGTGTITFTGAGAATQADQVASGSGAHTYTITGSGAPAQADQTAAGVGIAGSSPTGVGAATQDDQVAAGTGTATYTITGAGAATQADQTANGAGTHTYTITGSGTATQADQTASGAGLEYIVGSGAAAQADQTALGSGTVTTTVTGVGAAIQQNQVAAGIGTVTFGPSTGGTVELVIANAGISLTLGSPGLQLTLESASIVLTVEG